MTKPPAFQLYAAQFLASTAEMTAEEVGAYIRLLCQQWLKEGLPNDPARLATMAGCTSTALAFVLHRFSICEDGALRNSKLEATRGERARFVESRIKNAKKRWKTPETDALAQQVQCTSTASGELVQCSSSSSSSSSDNKEEVGAAGASPATTELKSGSGTVKKSKPAKKTPEQFIQSLATNPAYAHIDVAVELARMDAWLSVNPGRQKTPRFVVAWLNRIQAPIKPQEKQASTPLAPTKIQNGIRTGGW